MFTLCFNHFSCTFFVHFHRELFQIHDECTQGPIGRVTDLHVLTRIIDRQLYLLLRTENFGYSKTVICGKLHISQPDIEMF